MHPLVAFLLKVILCSAIFFAYYLLVLRNKSFHPYNRFYLLSTAVLSTVLPLLHIRMFDFTSGNERMLALFEMLHSGSGQLPALTPGRPAATANWELLGILIAAGVTLMLLTLMLVRILKVFALKKRFPSQTLDGVHFINTDIEQAPFSFLNNLFWRRDIRLSEQVGWQIYQHEMAHIRQKHSMDKLVMQVIRAVFWMNPVYYYMQRELLLIHEYMADKQAVRDGDTEAFARMLLTSQLGGFGFEPAHPLSYSSIKKRLHMITNSHRPKYSYLRRLLFLPLLFSVTFVFALRAHQKQIAVETQQLEQMVLAQQAEPSAGQLYTVSPRSIHWGSVFRYSAPADVEAQQTGPFSLVVDSVPRAKYQVKDVKIEHHPGGQSQHSDSPHFIIKDVKVEKAPQKMNRVRYSLSDSVDVVKNLDEGTLQVIPSKQALYVIDGTEMTAQEVASKQISTDQIDNVKILKDGYATQMYGQAGKNGVIIIQTKDYVKSHPPIKEQSTS